MKKVRIIGAGMSGLLTAYYARERGFEVEVFEKSSDVGGKIHTLKSKHGLMETAANAILADAEVERVASDIGLELIETKKTARRRWIHRAGKARRWPLGFGASLSLLLFLVKIKTHDKSVLPRAEEPLQAWGERVLGAETTENLLSPACLGIFGTDARELSASLIFHYFFSAVKRQKGKLQGSVAPREGLGEFPSRLKSYLQERGVKFFLNESLEKAEAVTVVATDLPSAALLLEKFGDDRAAVLKSLPNVDLCSCNVFYESSPEPEGFGVLFPRLENREPLGVLFNSSIFPGRVAQGSSQTWIFGGAHCAHDDQRLMEIVEKTRLKLWGSSGKALEFHVNRWPQAIPLYGLQLEKALSRLAISQNGVHLMGNYLGEIGLNRLFHRAKSLVTKL